MQTKKLLFIAIIICFTSQMLYGQYKEFMYDGIMREYAVIEPSLDPNPDGYPLVIGLHGAGSEGYEMIGTASLIAKANAEKFIVASPSALIYNQLSWWNAGDGYEEICNGTDDLGFVSALIDTMIKNYNVDTTRIYIIAHSNGSMMAYRVAAELSHRIAAIATNSGQMVYEYCDPEFPVPIIHFHGLSDPICPYEGKGDSIIVVPHADSVMAIWRGVNNCSSIPDTILNENGIVGRKWASLAGNSDIVLYTIEGWGHKWPRIGEPGIDATDVMWDFLKVQTRTTTTALDEKTFVYDGNPRKYFVYDPSPNSDTRPLVVGLHQGTGTAKTFIGYTGWLQKADDENFIAVFPNGTPSPIPLYWNAGGWCEQKTGYADDIGFISAVIDSMIKNYNVDTTRIYVTGHSNGSAMSYRMAAQLSHKIAAIGAVALQMVYEYCNPTHPVPIIHFHGLSDTTAPYEGGIVFGDAVIPHLDSTLAIWKEANDCNPTPDTIYNSSGIIGKKWPSIDGNGDIELYTIDDWGHGWPRTENAGISATDVIWDFLKLQTKSGVTNIKVDDTDSTPRNFTLYQNYPNPFNPLTRIKYRLAKSSRVVLKIYNLTGQEIETLVNKFQTKGEYKISWQPKGLPSGLYFYKIKAGEFSEIRKLTLLK